MARLSTMLQHWSLDLTWLTWVSLEQLMLTVQGCWTETRYLEDFQRQGSTAATSIDKYCIEVRKTATWQTKGHTKFWQVAQTWAVSTTGSLISRYMWCTQDPGLFNELPVDNILVVVVRKTWPLVVWEILQSKSWALIMQSVLMSSWLIS